MVGVTPEQHRSSSPTPPPSDVHGSEPISESSPESPPQISPFPYLPHLNPHGLVSRINRRVLHHALPQTLQPTDDHMLLRDKVAAVLTRLIDGQLKAHEYEFQDETLPFSLHGHRACVKAAAHPETITNWSDVERRKYYRICLLIEIAKENRESAALVKQRIRYYLSQLNCRVRATQRACYGLYQHSEQSGDLMTRLQDIKHCAESVDLSSLLPPLRTGLLQFAIPQDVVRAILRRNIDHALQDHERNAMVRFRCPDDCWAQVQAQPVAESRVARTRHGDCPAFQIRELYEIGRVDWDSAALVRRRVVLYLKDVDKRIKARNVQIQPFLNAGAMFRENFYAARDLHRLKYVRKCVGRVDTPNRLALGTTPESNEFPPIDIPSEVRQAILTRNIAHALHEHEEVGSGDEIHQKCWEVLQVEQENLMATDDPKWTHLRRLRDMADYPPDQILVRNCIEEWLGDVDRRVQDQLADLLSPRARLNQRDEIMPHIGSMRSAQKCIRRMDWRRDDQGRWPHMGGRV